MIGSVPSFSTGDKFSIEYVSNTPNFSSAMIQRLGVYFECDRTVVSPEDGIRGGNGIRYSGVVSGKFSCNGDQGSPEKQNSYASEDQFISEMKTWSKIS